MPEAVEAPATDAAVALKGSAAAAVLLMLFDEDEAAQILSRLEPDEVRQLGHAMYDVADVEIDEVNEALDHFVNKAKRRTTIGYGATQHIKGAMTKALGAERAENMLARITPPTRTTKLEMLKWLEAKEIAGLVDGEHPQVIALVLAYLDAPVAADVLQLLPAENQEEIIYRIATLGPVSGDALDDLEVLLLNGSPVAKSGSSSQRGGTTEAATIMNNVRKENEQRIMKALAKRDKQVATSIEEEMFVFDNLIDLDEKNLGTLMRTIDNDVLVVALKGCNDMLKGRIFGCMSARAAASIQDELTERGPMRLAEVIEAQKLIIATARRMADAGTIMLGGKGNDFV